MKAYLRHVNGHTFMAKSDSNHWVPVDTVSSGSGAANDPFQLLVIACGGCAFIDVVDILTKKREVFSLIELEIEAIRADSIPKILRSLEFHFMIRGENVSMDSLQRAINLSLGKYCSVSLSLDRSIAFRARTTINGEPGELWEIPRDESLYRL